MSTGVTSKDLQNIVFEISKGWVKKREEEAKTMCAKRDITEEEVDRALIIAKWFFAWNEDTGPCPIDHSTPYWERKMFALYEWIAVLEADNKKLEKEVKTLRRRRIK